MRSKSVVLETVMDEKCARDSKENTNQNLMEYAGLKNMRQLYLKDRTDSSQKNPLPHPPTQIKLRN